MAPLLHSQIASHTWLMPAVHVDADHPSIRLSCTFERRKRCQQGQPLGLPGPRHRGMQRPGHCKPAAGSAGDWLLSGCLLQLLLPPSEPALSTKNEIDVGVALMAWGARWTVKRSRSSLERTVRLCTTAAAPQTGTESSCTLPESYCRCNTGHDATPASSSLTADSSLMNANRYCTF